MEQEEHRHKYFDRCRDFVHCPDHKADKRAVEKQPDKRNRQLFCERVNKERALFRFAAPQNLFVRAYHVLDVFEVAAGWIYLKIVFVKFRHSLLLDVLWTEYNTKKRKNQRVFKKRRPRPAFLTF